MVKSAFITSLGLFIFVSSACTTSNQPQGYIKNFLEFRKNVRVEAIRVPIQPYVEFRIKKDFQNKFNDISASLVFDKEQPTTAAITQLFVRPIESYTINSISEVQSGRFEISVTEVHYDENTFMKKINVDRLFDLVVTPSELRSLPQSQVDARLGVLADNYVNDWPRNYDAALKVPTIRDELKYIVERRNGKIVLLIDSTKSKMAEESKAKKAEAIRDAVKYLRVVRCELNDYSNIGSATRGYDVFIKCMVKNSGNQRIAHSVDIEVELLDKNRNPVAREKTSIGFNGLEPNFSDDCIVVFSKDKAVDWSGPYRLRIGDKDLNIYSDWKTFAKKQR